MRNGGLSFILKCVDTKESFVKALAKFAPEIILAGNKLPSYDGLSALHLVKITCPEVPFIFVTEAMGEEWAIETLKKGAADYVLKDRLSRIVPAIKRALLEADARKKEEHPEESIQKKQNDLMNSIINNQKDTLIFSLDKKYCYTAFNENHRREMKKVYNADIKIGHCMLDYINVAEVKPLAKASYDLALGGKSFTEEQKQPGLGIWYEFNWNPVRSAEEEIVGISVFIRNISERKKADVDLLASEVRYRRLFETAKDGILILDAETGEIDDVNPFLIEMLGYSHDQFLRKKIWEVGLFKDIVANKDNFDELQQKGYIRYEDKPLKTADGRQKNVEFVSNVYLVNNKKVIQCNIRDITERKKAEGALLLSEEKFRSYLESAPDGVFIVDNTGRYIESNPSASRITGYSKEEITKMSIRDILAEESLEDGLAHFKKIIETGTAVSELWHKRKDGSKCCLLVNAVKLSETRFLGFFQDITERKEGEEKLRESYKKLRKTFAGTSSALASALEKRDQYTAGHQNRVSQLAFAIAKEMGMTEDQIEGVRIAGILHDIGKLNIPAEILSKPGKLTDLEFSFIKTHAQSGCDILKDIEFPWPIAKMVLQHHERINGSGYPQGLAGENILTEAKILAVADVVEAMASHRPYRAALGIDKALLEILQNKGTIYDPNAVDACLKVFSDKKFKFQF